MGKIKKLGRLVHDVRHELGVDGLADSFPALDLDRVGLLDAVEHVLVPRRTVLGVLGVLVEDGVVVALGSNTPELPNLKQLEVRKQKKKNKKHTIRSIKVSSSIGGTSDIFISLHWRCWSSTDMIARPRPTAPMRTVGQREAALVVLRKCTRRFP